jgi:hypothetical protein
MPLTLRQIAETAAFASARSMLLIESRAGISDACLHNYWKCCRGRLIDWLHVLDELESQASLADGEAEHRELWNLAVPVLSEIFVSDLLTRVWATVLSAADLHRGQERAAPIVRHTFKGQVEARHRASQLILSGRKCERWSDLLIGHLVLNYQLDEFAFESHRSLEFGQSQVREILRATDEPAWEFVIAGIRLSFQDESQAAPSDAWNRGIVRAVLSSFPADCFEEAGTFRSIRRVRIERSGEVSDQVADSASSPNPSEPGQGTKRLRFSDLRQRHGND